MLYDGLGVNTLSLCHGSMLPLGTKMLLHHSTFKQSHPTFGGAHTTTPRTWYQAGRCHRSETT